jgi:hypothetical protein
MQNSEEHILKLRVFHQSNGLLVFLTLPPNILKFLKISNNYVQEQCEYIATGSDDSKLHLKLRVFGGGDCVHHPVY